MLPFAWWGSDAAAGGAGDQFITVTETASILDTASLDKVDPAVSKTAHELISVSELIALAKAYSVQETAFILDTADLDQIDPSVDKVAHELISVAELIAIQLQFLNAETVNILDTASLDKVDPSTVKIAHELIAVSELINLVMAPPAIASCDIQVDQNFERARATFNTGIRTQSVIVEKQVDFGGWTFHQNMDTSPNTNGYVSNWYNGTAGEEVQFRIRPFAGDNQTGEEGPACTTPSDILTGGGPA